MAIVRHVDRQGRIALPTNWRSETLKEDKEVVVTELDDSLIIRPRHKVDLTKFFDSVEVDVDPGSFSDYRLLKHALLKNHEKRGKRTEKV